MLASHHHSAGDVSGRTLKTFSTAHPGVSGECLLMAKLLLNF